MILIPFVGVKKYLVAELFSVYHDIFKYKSNIFREYVGASIPKKDPPKGVLIDIVGYVVSPSLHFG